MFTIHFEKTSHSLQAGIAADFTGAAELEREVLSFCQAYLDGEQQFAFRTSGSTGAPKILSFQRHQLQISAQATLDHLGIKDGGNALLCMNPGFTGGRMMMVRAMEGNLDLWVQPAQGTPDLTSQRIYDLAAMVPLQVQNLLKLDDGGQLLAKCRNLLIGGAPVDPQLESQLQGIPNHIYHTFGMTETLSHFALRDLNGDQPGTHYQLLPGYQMKVDKDQCLVVWGPVTDQQEIHTQDVVALKDTNTFNWLGRKDQVINSGGYKIYPQKVERAFQKILPLPCHLLAQKHPKWGQQAVLMVESPPLSPKQIGELKTQLQNVLHPFEIPKHIVTLETFPLASSGKTDLSALRQYLPPV